MNDLQNFIIKKVWRKLRWRLLSKPLFKIHIYPMMLKNFGLVSLKVIPYQKMYVIFWIF